MSVVTFALLGDPHATPRVGALVDDGRAIVDLQAAHFAMTGAPHPALRSVATLEGLGEAAGPLVARILAWVASQDPPGMRVERRLVRLL